MAKSKYIDRDNLYSDRMNADGGDEDLQGLPAEVGGAIAGPATGVAGLPSVAPAKTTSSGYSQTQEKGMVPIYSQPVYETKGHGNQVLVDQGGKFLGYQKPEATPAGGKIETPKPPEILAKEKELGHELEPIYAMGAVQHGSGTSQPVEYGEPIGYRYDNGKSEYVNFDTSGQQTSIRERSNLGTLIRDLAPLALTAVGANFLAPMLAGGAAGAAGTAAAPLAFTPEMIAAGATPGSIGALGAAKGLLDASQLASLYGVNSGIATLAPTLSQLPSGPPSTPGTPPPPGLEPPIPSGIETLPSGPPSTPGTPPPPPSGIETLPSGPPSTPGTPPPPNLESPIPSGPPGTPGTPPPPNLESPIPSGPPGTPGTPPPPNLESPVPSGPPSTPGTPPPPDVGPPGSNIPPPTPTLPPTATPGTPPPPDVGPPGSNISPVVPPVPTPGLPSITDILSGKNGTLGQLVSLMALYGGIKTLGGGIGQTGQGVYKGYEGGIPTYTASRTMNAVPEGRRPGQGGINYFSPMKYTKAAAGGVMHQGLGSFSDGGRLLRGPGDGVSDSIPATIGRKQPARLADGEFVVPARIVSEIGNGSTEAGARKLYAMMDRVQNARKKSLKNVAANTKADRYLPT